MLLAKRLFVNKMNKFTLLDDHVGFIIDFDFLNQPGITIRKTLVLTSKLHLKSLLIEFLVNVFSYIALSSYEL